MVNMLREKAANTRTAVVKVISRITTKDGRVAESTGSGFIVTEDGIVITNSHVIINHVNALNSVQLDDGTEKQCIEVIHNDQSHDFAILRIEEDQYSFLELGEYEDVEVGDDIYFCGYPLRSIHFTINGGIISSKFNESNIRLIQIDGSVNSGNSGGPLLNFQDKVVGIVTEKAGGIDKKLLGISKFVKNAPTVFTLDYTTADGKKVKVDPTKSLADVIEIIHDYTSVGIGYAYSIEYAKSKLTELELL